jgi:hypothetical protein
LPRRLLRAFFPLTLLLCPAVAWAQAAAQEMKDTLLEPGRAVERELAGGAANAYIVESARGQFVRVVVEQRGVDVVVKLYPRPTSSKPRSGGVARPSARR